MDVATLQMWKGNADGERIIDEKRCYRGLHALFVLHVEWQAGRKPMAASASMQSGAGAFEGRRRGRIPVVEKKV